MATTNLRSPEVTISDGKDGLVVVNNYTSKRGGTSLDVTGFAPLNIRAGHVIIKDASGNFKPMPVVASIAALGSFNEGASYTNNGTYTDVSLTGGSGTGAKATIVVTANKVSAVTLTDGGSGYKAGDILSAAAADIGTTGTGFAVSVASTGVATGYGSLPANHTYAGHAVNTVLTAKAMVGVMYNGEINDLVIDAANGIYNLASIKTALKAALPQMMYTGDNV